MKGEKDNAIKYANLAVDLDSKRIAEKIKKEPLFITVLTKISIPFNLEEKEEVSRFSAKEIKAKEHLEKTQEITTNMGYGENIKKSIEKLEKSDTIYLEKDN